jgi:hypothetical protein
VDRGHDASGRGYDAPGDDDHVGTTGDVDVEQRVLRIHLK